MPEAWPKASLENVIIAGNSVSVYYETTESGYRVRVTQQDPEWELQLRLKDENAEKGFMVMASQVEAIPENGEYVFTSKGNELLVTVRFQP